MGAAPHIHFSRDRSTDDISCGDPLSSYFPPIFLVRSLVLASCSVHPRKGPCGFALSYNRKGPLLAFLFPLLSASMLSFSVQMDLSSLEGPPIRDSRFSGSPTPSAASVPHIRLEHTFSPVSPMETNTWDLPPRPASTSAIAPRSKYPNAGSNGLQQNIPHSNEYNARPNYRTPPNQSLHPEVSREVAHRSGAMLSPSRAPRSHSNSVSSPHQLVWIESEQIWVLTTRTTTPTQPQRPQYSRSSPGSVANTGPQYPPQSTNPYPPQSTNLYPPTADYEADIEAEDLPPPYEQHVFDQPLGPILPAVARVCPEQIPQRGSRWTAIGRRVG